MRAWATNIDDDDDEQLILSHCQTFSAANNESKMRLFESHPTVDS